MHGFPWDYLRHKYGILCFEYEAETSLKWERTEYVMRRFCLFTVNYIKDADMVRTYR